MATPFEMERVPEDKPLLKGRRIVDIDALQKIIKLSEKHARACTGGSLSIVSENRNGLEAEIFLVCAMCEKRFNCFNTSDRTDDLNKAAVWGTHATGSTYKHTEEFLSILNIPAPSNSKFYNLENSLSEVKLTNTQ